MFECKKKRVCCTRGRQKEKGKGFLLKAQQHLVLCLDLLFVHCRTWSRKVHRHKEYKQKIMANYQPLHRELYAMHAENFFVPSFLRAISENTEESFRSMIIEPSQGVYIFEMLQPRFCELLFDEVENFERWVHDTKFRIMRPNTMNKYGAVLDDFGMESMLDKLMNEFIRPMSKGKGKAKH